MSTKVLVVDDTALFRRILSDVVQGIPGAEVVGTAPNGRVALARIAALKPDLLTLDMEMPEMGGMEVLEALAASPIRPGVIVVSALTTRSAELTVRALERGAFDFITKPEGASLEANRGQLRSQLEPVIRAFDRKREIRGILNNGHLNGAFQDDGRPQPPDRAPLRSPSIEEMPARGGKAAGKPFVLIAVSTGGPNALARVIPALPADLGVPVFIVQHMPPLFTGPLAASLAGKSRVQVKEACDGEVALPNCVYLAPGGRQMKLTLGRNGGIQIRVTDDPPEHNYRPCADYLFRSAALQFPGRSVTAILTGMGSDGTSGLKLLKRSGCRAIAQDEASCVVFGMPKEAIATGLVDVIIPLDQIADAIVRAVREGCP